MALLCVLGLGCGRKPAPAAPPGERQEPKRPVTRPEHTPGSLDRRASFSFDGTLLPEVISRVSQDTGLQIGVSASIPVDEWSKQRVTLRMADVTVRDFLDWLARLVRAEYAVDADGAVWLCRGDDLLLSEPMRVRAYRVPTHFDATVPLPGLLDFAKEQEAIIAVLEECLRYLRIRRPGCRLAFHGQQDVLAARLTPRGHTRLQAILDAMRYGAEPPPEPRPTAAELRARLDAPVQCDWPPGPLGKLLPELAQRAGVNLGWDAASIGSSTVVIPRGARPLASVLDAIVRQTPVGRYRAEAGRGIWLYLEGQDVDYPRSRATPWDRAVVRAYETEPLLRAHTAEEIIAGLHRQVDPGKWDQGLPAAAIFAPLCRLIVVCDEEGQPRIEAALRAMLAGSLSQPEKPRNPE